MIIDSINHWEAYKGILPNYEEAMRFAESVMRETEGFEE